MILSPKCRDFTFPSVVQKPGIVKHEKQKSGVRRQESEVKAQGKRRKAEVEERSARPEA